MRIIGTIISICVLIAISIFLVWAFGEVFLRDDDCLKEIAEDYCEDNGMVLEEVYSGYYPILTNMFECGGDERSLKRNVYKFLEDEIEGCKDKE